MPSARVFRKGNEQQPVLTLLILTAYVITEATGAINTQERGHINTVLA